MSIEGMVFSGSENALKSAINKSINSGAQLRNAIALVTRSVAVLTTDTSVHSAVFAERPMECAGIENDQAALEK